MIALASLPPWNGTRSDDHRRRRPAPDACSRSNPGAGSAPRGLLLLGQARLLISNISANSVLAALRRVGKRLAAALSLIWRSSALTPARPSSSDHAQVRHRRRRPRRLPL
jgi:hypothetical protein